MAPAGIDRGADDAGLARGLELGAHVAAEPGDLAPHQRIAIGTNRLGVRRDEEARVAAAHLVMIHVGLRQPVAIHQLADVLRLRQVEREAVAVVVVAGVLLVQPRQVRTPRAACRRIFMYQSAIICVPSGLIDGSTMLITLSRIAHRLFVGAGQAVVDELGGRLRRRHFGRVQREALDRDGLAVGDSFFTSASGHAARIGEPAR